MNNSNNINNRGLKWNSIATNVLRTEFSKEGLLFNTHRISESDIKEYNAIKKSILKFAEKTNQELITMILELIDENFEAYAYIPELKKLIKSIKINQL